MNLLEHTSRVSFELSNRCNYAHLHKQCPLYTQREAPIILSQRLVFNTLAYLYHAHFKGTIAFHVYNEPLIDPRLFYFLYVCQDYNLSTFILTNGYCLNQTLATELKEIGVKEIIVSAYSEEEEKRLKEIKLDISYTVTRRMLDDRLDIYDQPKIYYKTPCTAPLNEIVIGCDGKVRLCCLDWRGIHNFGNLYNTSLPKILERGGMQYAHEQLSKGKRVLDICQRCRTSR